MGPDTTHSYGSAQVHLIIINEGGIIIISVELHVLVLQVVVIIIEVRVEISTDIFTFLLLRFKLDLLFTDGLLESGHLLAKTIDEAILLVTLTTK